MAKRNSGSDVSTELTETPTYCRICEAFCGLIATAQSGTVIKLRPDADHLSKGFACPKGISYTEIHRDPDRLQGPMQRCPDGNFEPISWDLALTEIGDRLKGNIATHGGKSVGIYAGNPMAYNDGAWIWASGLINRGDYTKVTHLHAKGERKANVMRRAGN